MESFYLKTSSKCIMFKDIGPFVYMISKMLSLCIEYLKQKHFLYLSIMKYLKKTNTGKNEFMATYIYLFISKYVYQTITQPTCLFVNCLLVFSMASVIHKNWACLHWYVNLALKKINKYQLVDKKHLLRTIILYILWPRWYLNQKRI